MSRPLAAGGSARELVLLGVPVEAGAGRRGCVMGPAALRTAGLYEVLVDLGFAVADRGDLTPLASERSRMVLAGRANHPDEISAWIRPLARQTYDILGSGSVPILLGGDHSLSMGSVTGAARHARDLDRPLFVLWLDAHADFNTPETSPSGNMHGMSTAFLCAEPGLDAVMGEEPRVAIDPERLTLFGVRSIDGAERSLLAARGVHVVDMRTIDEFGVSVPIRRILEEVGAVNGLLHVSLDVDFLDPAIAPAVGTLVPGGATYREAHLILEMIHDSELLTSLDIVELNPFLDDRGQTARLLVDLVASLFGRRIIDRPSPGGRLMYRPD